MAEPPHWPRAWAQAASWKPTSTWPSSKTRMGRLTSRPSEARRGVLLGLAHLRRLFGQAQARVELAAGVEELFQGQAAGLVPGLQLLQGGVVLFNVPNGVGELVLVQPLLGLLQVEHRG